MNIKKLAEDKYKYFCELEGNDYISSIYMFFKCLNMLKLMQMNAVNVVPFIVLLFE